MATREEVMARINLFGVLRSIQELVTLDVESRNLVKDTQLTVEFVIRGLCRGTLRFSSGACEFIEGRPDVVDVRLFFTSPAHFNRMVEGKSNPIPLKGWLKIGFLTGPFTKLTERLSYFLRPEGDVLEDPGAFEINTKLTAFVAFHAVTEVANWDVRGRAYAAQVPDGVLQVDVQEGGPAIAIEVAAGRLRTLIGAQPDYRCLMWFRDLETLAAVLDDGTDSFVVFAGGRAGIRGYVPMADKLNSILGLLPGYLS